MSPGEACDAHEHYERLLARHYTWMSGDFDDAVAREDAVFERFGIAPESSGTAVDLGCGSGFQSIALAGRGFRVRAIDLSETLLGELQEHAGSLPIAPLRGDIRDVASLAARGAELVVCMGDTLTHLPTITDIRNVLAGCRYILAQSGALVLTFRDLTRELTGTDRFIPLRADDDRIMTVALEYEAEHVLVTDLVHVRDEAGWQLHAGSYRKLRLDEREACELVQHSGLTVEHRETRDGVVTIVARKT